MSKHTPNETHPLFPSGEWEGFYTYTYGPNAAKDPMQFTLEFKDGKVTGGGADPVGSFSWQGVYDTVQQTCNMQKQYLGRHTVNYVGHVDESGIWGNWDIRKSFKGGFHIWPKKNEAEAERLESVALEKNAKKSVPKVVSI